MCQFLEPKIVKMRDIFPTLKPGKYGQASTVAPSADKLKTDETAGEIWKRASL
jgi:hypothetical protein